MRVVIMVLEKGEQLVPNLSFGNLRFYHSVFGEKLTLISIIVHFGFDEITLLSPLQLLSKNFPSDFAGMHIFSTFLHLINIPQRISIECANVSSTDLSHF